MERLTCWVSPFSSQVSHKNSRRVSLDLDSVDSVVPGQLEDGRAVRRNCLGQRVKNLHDKNQIKTQWLLG